MSGELLHCLEFSERWAGDYNEVGIAQSHEDVTSSRRDC